MKSSSDQNREILSPPVFNPERFAMVTLGDAGLQAQLVAAFLREAPAALVQLQDAGHSGEKPFGDAVHRLRSSVHFVAAERLQLLLAQVAEQPATKRADRLCACRRIARELADLVQMLEQVPLPVVA